jgi:hypothetical protein
MPECEMYVWWSFYYMTVRSFIYNITPFTHSNKNCEGVQRGFFGRLGGERYSTCNEVQSNVTLIRKIVIIKLSVFCVTMRHVTSS